MEEDFNDTVKVVLTDTLDLHTFRPAEIGEVVQSFLDQAWEQGFRVLRIIHGKGIGMQRRTVHTLLTRDPRVHSFKDADGSGGGWGATEVRLRDD